MFDISDIGKVRKQLGLTQTDLARAACVSQSLIAKIESGRIEPSYTNAKRIFDALDNMAKKSGAKAKDVMNRRMISASPEQKVMEIVPLMKKYGISQLPVLNKCQPVGLVTEAAILEKVASSDLRQLIVADVMGECPPIISENASIDAVSGLLRHFPIVLVADKGKLQGLISKSDIISYLPYLASAANARTARSGLE